MSLILRDPFIRDLLFDDYNNYNNHMLRRLQDVLTPTVSVPAFPASLMNDLELGGMRSNRTEDGTLRLAVDCSQYKPDEIQVKLCDDNLVIEAKTESSGQDSYHKAEFKRWIKLPQDVKHEAIKSTLTADKKLVVEVPCHKPIQADRSRNIPIQIQKAAPKPAVEGDKASVQQQQQQQQQQSNGQQKN